MASALDKLKDRAKANQPTGPETDIPLSKIRFDPHQPRKAFHHIDGVVAPKDQEYIEVLASQIEKHGLLQAITVEEMGDGTYRVVMGECRTRAHMHLGRTTIRAAIRNDLGDPVKRMLAQLAENVTREELSDADLAESIANLMKGLNGAKPLKQFEIAAELGKSEGWVTRYVKFGDDELQRLWGATGIATTPENLYRLSILPTHAQVEIRRRVDLPVDHEEFLAKPVDRAVIDQYAREAKIAKTESALRQTAPVAPNSGAQNATEDATGQTLAGLAAAGQQGGKAEAPASGGGGTATKPPQYTLAPDVRNAILNNKTGGSSETASTTGKGAALPPVSCRATLGNLRALFALLDQDGAATNVDDVPCNLNFSGSTAQDLANLLAGVVVEPREVPAVLQSELTRLQLQQA